jgi:hypothetical protein
MMSMFNEFAITDSENLPDDDRRSAFGRREANMKKHHVVLCNDIDGHPSRKKVLPAPRGTTRTGNSTANPRHLRPRP